MQVIDITPEVVRNVVSPHTPPETSGALAPQKSHANKGKFGSPAKGPIKVAAARIFWSTHPDTDRVIDVWVSSAELTQEELTREYFSPRWSSVVGNCDCEWLEELDYTPEAVFGELIEIGFHSSSALSNALRQFAKIDVCVWALPMLSRLGGL